MKHESSLAGHTRPVNAVAWNPQGDCLASGSDDGWIKVWDPVTGTCLTTLNGEKPVYCVTFSSDGVMLAAGGGYRRDGSLKVFDTRTGALVPFSMNGHDHVVSCLAFKPDDPDTLVSGLWDGTLKCWTVLTGTATLIGHSNADGAH